MEHTSVPSKLMGISFPGDSSESGTACLGIGAITRGIQIPPSAGAYGGAVMNASLVSFGLALGGY